MRRRTPEAGPSLADGGDGPPAVAGADRGDARLRGSRVLLHLLIARHQTLEILQRGGGVGADCLQFVGEALDLGVRCVRAGAVRDPIVL